MLKNRIGYFMIFLVALFLMLFYHNFFFFLFFLIIVCLPIFSYFVGRYAFAHTNVDVDIPVNYLGEGHELKVNFILENGSRFPMPSIVIDYYALNHFYPNEERQHITLPLRNGRHEFKWSLSSIYSGRVEIKVYSYTIQDYLGLFLFKSEANISKGATIVPEKSNVLVNFVEDYIASEGEEVDEWNRTEDVTEIKDFRTYIPGDKPSRIHWKLSERQDELYVKEYMREADLNWTLLLELRRDTKSMGDLNSIITAFYSVAMYMLDMDMRFQVRWMDAVNRSFVDEMVNDEDTLLLVLRQIFMMDSYEGDNLAYTEYLKTKTAKDRCIYFVVDGDGQVSFDKEQVLGRFEDRVMIVCL